jgi:aspartate/methionine/tyrosine aminotransferase
MDDLTDNYKRAQALGVKVKAIVVINPGNPTGQVMSKKNLEDIVKFCYEHKIVICADEVYQINIYGSTPFVSLKKVMNELGAPYNTIELVSFHSTSKGLIGECGLRGGYMEIENFDPYVQSQILKLRTITLCPNTIGQLTCELMLNPPKEGVNSKEVVETYKKECDLIFGGLKKRSKLLTQKLNEIPGIKANELEGAMYSFPSVLLTESACKAAKAKGIAPDVLFCVEALEETGIVMVPGSGFKQKDGTHHFRITNLIYQTEEFDKALDAFKEFCKKFFAKYP